MRYRTVWGCLAMVTALAVPATLAAQVTVGIGAGPTFSKITGDDVEEILGGEAESTTGFFVGGSLGIPLTDILGIGTGVYLVEKGTDVRSSSEVATVDLQYIEIPITLQVTATGPDRPVGVDLFAGPSLGFNVSCDAEEPGGETSDCDEDVENFDFGLLFGAGVGFSAGESMAITINGGIDIGLSTVAETDDMDDGPEDPDFKNQAFFFGVNLSWLVGG